MTRFLKMTLCQRIARLATVLAICLSTSTKASEKLPAPIDWPCPVPAVHTPGPDYAPPIDDAIAIDQAAPVLYEHSPDAGPDQSFFAVGARLTGDLLIWGRAAESSAGREWKVATPLVDDNYLAATLPDRAFDSVFLVWAKNQAGWSRPVRLNVPQPWFCWPKEVAAGCGR